MTVLINYTSGVSKLIMDVSSIEDSELFLQLSYESGVETVAKHHIRDIRVSL